MPRFEHHVIAHRKGVSTMPGGWLGIDAEPSTEERTVLAKMGAEGWQLVAVTENTHATERTYFFARPIEAVDSYRGRDAADGRT